MNTKFFILLAVCLMISYPSSPITTRKKLQAREIIYNQNVELTAPLEETDVDSDNIRPVDLDKHTKVKNSRPHSEEDGKHHHIHFHRLTQHGRRRLILLWLAKLILFISHISVLIYVFMHSMH